MHGLAGSSHKTWCKNHDPDLLWPKTWLSLEPELRSARILTFGYEASFASVGPSSISNVTDFAKALLYDLRFWRDEAQDDNVLGEV